MDQAPTRTNGPNDVEPLVGADPTSGIFRSLIETALVEFRASLQLLSERSRFLTGAIGTAIAIEDSGVFVYFASTGSSVPEIGIPANCDRDVVRKCIQTAAAATFEASIDGPVTAILAIPIIRNQKVCGFFELATNPGFSARDIQAVSPLAEMVNTALDHLQAADQADIRILEPGLAKPSGPTLWHAPQ